MLPDRRRETRDASSFRAKSLSDFSALTRRIQAGEDRTLAEETDFVSGVSGRYASALFALAQERRETAATAEALQKFDAMIAESC